MAGFRTTFCSPASAPDPPLPSPLHSTSPHLSPGFGSSTPAAAAGSRAPCAVAAPSPPPPTPVEDSPRAASSRRGGGAAAGAALSDHPVSPIFSPRRPPRGAAPAVPALTVRADGALEAANPQSLLLGTVVSAPDAGTTRLRQRAPNGGREDPRICLPAAEAPASPIPGASPAAAAAPAAASDNEMGPRSEGLASGAAAIVDAPRSHGAPAGTPDAGRLAEYGPQRPPWFLCAGGGRPSGCARFGICRAAGTPVGRHSCPGSFGGGSAPGWRQEGTGCLRCCCGGAAGTRRSCRLQPSRRCIGQHAGGGGRGGGRGARGICPRSGWGCRSPHAMWLGGRLCRRRRGRGGDLPADAGRSRQRHLAGGWRAPRPRAPQARGGRAGCGGRRGRAAKAVGAGVCWHRALTARARCNPNPPLHTPRPRPPAADGGAGGMARWRVWPRGGGG